MEEDIWYLRCADKDRYWRARVRDSGDNRARDSHQTVEGHTDAVSRGSVC